LPPARRFGEDGCVLRLATLAAFTFTAWSMISTLNAPV
jgi:hypothetical protein